MTLYLLILVLSLVAEALYGGYVLFVNRRMHLAYKLLGAVGCTLGLNLVNGIVTIYFVHDNLLILPAATGEGLGTLAIVLAAYLQDKKEAAQVADQAAQIASLQERVDELEARTEEQEDLLRQVYEVEEETVEA